MSVSSTSYSGEPLTFVCDTKSAVRRSFTVNPQSPALSLGLFTLADTLILVFALAPFLQLLLAPSSADSGGSSSLLSAILFLAPAPPDMRAQVLLLRALLVVFVARVAWRIATRVPAERLTVVRNVGVQLHRHGLLGGWRAVELIDVGTITSLVIHEGFQRHRCVFFLAIVCQDRPRTVLPFHNTMPRLPVLRAVLRGARAVLYGEPENGSTLAEIEAEELAALNSSNNNSGEIPSAATTDPSQSPGSHGNEDA
jgi:hypothetical protein